MNKKYIIRNSGKELYDGNEVLNVKKEDVEFLDNTFSNLNVKNIFNFKASSISHRMENINSLRFYVQETEYNDGDLKRTRYYSRIKTKAIYEQNKGVNLVFKGFDNKFTHLLIVEDKIFNSPDKKFYSCNDGFKIEKSVYESIIKEAILCKRIGSSCFF